MHILFDASTLFSCQGGGIYNYLVKLLPSLIRRIEANGDQISFLHLHFRREQRDHPALSGRKTVAVRLPVRLLNQLWVRTGMPDLSHWLPEVQVVHSPHFSLPVMTRARKVLTVNDITYLKHPEYFAPSGRAINDYGYRFLLPANIRRADRIIAISDHTKRDLVEYFRLPEEKVAVVHIGCDMPSAMAPDELSPILTRFGVKAGEYVYFPAGTLEPRKNLPLTVAAFHAIRKNGLQLIISGVGSTTLPAEASGNGVRLVRWQTDEERNALYQGALFVVYPSLYEGFGMPVVEAMGNGKAVLTANTTSLKEIAEGFAHTLDPQNQEALVEGFRRLLDDLPYRRELERRAFTRARDFTWEAMAEKTYIVYKDCC